MHDDPFRRWTWERVVMHSCRMSDDDADQGPITVPYEEPSEEDQERWRREAELGDLINSVCDTLKREVEYVQQIASYTNADSTREEIGTLAAHCGDLSSKGYAAASQLTAAGIQDWVYSVKACNEVGFRANEAAGQAYAATTSESGTEIKIMLDAVVNDLGYAASSINGA